MSKKKNIEQVLDAILRELRAEARAYGFTLELNVHSDRIPVSKQATADTPLPKRAEEILCEILTKHYLKLCEAVNAVRAARGEKPIGNSEQLDRFKRIFDKAYYGKLRHSEKGRRIVDLLRAWHGGQIMEQSGWCRIDDTARIRLLTPLLDAVRDLDVEFFQLLAQAAQMLDTRVRSSKDASIGTGDTELRLWLLQYGMRTGGTRTHTALELNEQYVSKFRKMSVEKLREECNELAVALKPDRRGKAAKRYGTITGRNLK
jgi:hypothetical protein